MTDVLRDILIFVLTLVVTTVVGTMPAILSYMAFQRERREYNKAARLRFEAIMARHELIVRNVATDTEVQP